jgi:predicted transposase YbfD/YdcC
MDTQARGGLMRLINEIEDPRCNQGKRHRLSDMLVIAICALICHADGWEDIQLFGSCKERWFNTFLELPHGIPSHDTFARVFARLNPVAFEACFRQWMSHLAKVSKGRLIAVDGKTLRRSFDTAAGKAALHMINAWCVTNQTVLGQVACGIKENEITALPKLLELLDLSGAVVTADAMHCQKETAQRILNGKGDYLLQVKANQPALYENVRLLFEEGFTGDCQGVAYDFFEETDAGHGRIETRRCWSSWDIAGVAPTEWPGLRSVVCIERTRQVGDKNSSTARHYYISSLPGRDAAYMLRLSRGHWGIENQLHWCMDVVFSEDQRRIRKENADENYVRLSRIALNLLKTDTSRKISIRQKRKLAGWDHDYLLHLITQGT